MILRELPRQIIHFRKNMKELTEKLQRKKIRYRWELPIGIIFSLGERTVKIKSEDQKDLFIKENEKDLEEQE